MLVLILLWQVTLQVSQELERVIPETVSVTQESSGA